MVLRRGGEHINERVRRRRNGGRPRVETPRSKRPGAGRQGTSQEERGEKGRVVLHGKTREGEKNQYTKEEWARPGGEGPTLEKRKGKKGNRGKGVYLGCWLNRARSVLKNEQGRKVVPDGGEERS